MKTTEFISVKKMKPVLSVFLFLFSFTLHAQETNEPNDFHSSMYSKSLFISLLLAAMFLLILIMVLAAILKSILHYKSEKEKRKKNNSGKISGVIIFFLISGTLQAQQNLTMQKESDWSVGEIDPLTFYSLVAFLIFETAIALFFLNQIRILLSEYKSKSLVKVKERVTLMDKLNASVSVEKEREILLDHNYDGIRELDNSLPPWWKYMFYATCIWAVIYLIHFHILKTGKSQLQEYEQEMAEGKAQVEKYRKRSAENVDENNIAVLTDASSLDEGKSIFTEFCVACHGNSGEGGLGPNIADDYWLHGGSIKDVFKSVKYGWPEKGMKSWQQELNPKKMHQVSSYILSLSGTNPSGAKAAQGELYVPESSDSVSVQPVSDTLIPPTDPVK